MKKQKVCNDFETLSTYNYVNKKSEKVKPRQQDVPEKDSSSLQSVKICAPTKLEEVNLIISSLKQNEAVIVDLTYKNINLQKKVLNYLNGAVFALGGSINKLVDNIYLILPQGVSLNL